MTVSELAAAHGLMVDAEQIRIVEAGLDYRVAFAVAADGNQWVLRIPRREDVAEKIGAEASILDFVRPQLTAAVPDWQIRTRELIAYPLLPGKPGLTLSDEGEPQWHFDQESPRYAHELGALIAQLHAMDPEAARSAGIPVYSAEDVREQWRSRLEQVCAEFTISTELLEGWRAWIAEDGLWPQHTVFTHGELYPAHLLLDAQNSICSVLDWTTAQVADPAVDFMYHHMLASPESFRTTVETYAEITGHEHQRLEERCAALIAAGPLTYAEYALTTGQPDHLAAATAQLNP